MSDEALYFHDKNRFRLSNQQWLTLCREFSLNYAMWDWESVEDLYRFELEKACSVFEDEKSESPVKQLAEIEAFLRSTEEMLRRFSPLHLDVGLSRALIRDMKAKLPESSFANYRWAWPIDEEPPPDICHDLIKHIEVIRDSTKLEIDRRSKLARRVSRNPAKFLLNSLCKYWESLGRHAERNHAYVDAKGPPTSATADFLIRVPALAFGVTITPGVADHAIRQFKKEKKQEQTDFGDDD
jgi:hypothetical protein